MEASSTQVVLALALVSLAGALPPLSRRWSAGGLHLFAALSAGILLGTVFLHLLPEMAEESSEMGSGPWYAALGGFLGLFLLEKVWLRGERGPRGADRHTIVWLAAFVGLSVHALAEGLGLSALSNDPARLGVLLLPILWHKFTETFSLSTVMRLGSVGARRGLALLFLFACVTPAGLLLGGEIASSSTGARAWMTGFASGTFLYVAVCDLLPEVFHDLDRRRYRVLWLLLGVAASGAMPHHFDAAPDLALAFLRESWEVFVRMAPYLLLGFGLAGILSQVLQPRAMTRYMARNDLRSVSVAAVVGAPLPLCSCSVIPVAAALRRSGASKGATSSFLISTPETGVDSVSVTWALLDPLMTIVRPLAAVASAVFTGLAVGLFARGRGDDARQAGLAPAGERGCSDGCESSSVDALDRGRPAGDGRGLVARSLRYAFVEMIDDLAGALVIGVLLSGMITAVVPDAWFQGALLGGAGGLVVMLLIAIPVYVCAAASTPMAAAMVLKGLSPGAALVFLLAGPATNMATLAVMTRTLGRRAVWVHLGALSVVTLALGAALDLLYPALGLQVSARVAVAQGEAGRWLGIASATVLGALLLSSLWRTYVGGASAAGGSDKRRGARAGSGTSGSDA